MKSASQGYTLLELLIALALALFLSSGTISIFIQCKKTFHLAQRLHMIQNSARIAFNCLSRDIRMAGLIGCVSLVDFSPLNSQLTPNTSLLVWRAGETKSELNLPYLPRAKTQSDIVLIQALDPHTIPVKFAKDKHIVLAWKPLFRTTDKVLISDCQHAEAFQWGNIRLKYSYENDSEVGLLNKIIYYIAFTGRKTTADTPIYALYRRDLNKSLNNPIELVEGIEKMSIRLGVKKGANGSLVYVPAEQVKQGAKVRSLEITLLFNDKNPLQREWKHIIALRERETYD